MSDAPLRARVRLTVPVASRAALELRAECEFPVPPLSLPQPGQAESVNAWARYSSVALAFAGWLGDSRALGHVPHGVAQVARRQGEAMTGEQAAAYALRGREA